MKWLWLGVAMPLVANAVELYYEPAPADNPLRGLVPYVSADGRDQFPHSMEFRYFPLRAVIKGSERFDWSAVEDTLREVAGRGNQLIFRFYCEYPGRGNEVPEFLREAGVKVTEWKDDEGQVCFTPDYEDPQMRAALREFVRALGEKYDGDPRIAFVTAGLLGKWGEWHTYPREELWASKKAQREVMEAYAGAFQTTKILLRYPAGPEDGSYAGNGETSFGYHDDSFCWATLDTGREEDDWFFEPLLKAAGATGKWKHAPIGGEIRPELWKRSFTAHRHERDQGFPACVERLHVTWLMDSGLFTKEIPVGEARRETALREVARMGYELHVAKAEWKNGELALTVENRGVAPFYHDWPVELQSAGQKAIHSPESWKLSAILPGEPVTWKLKAAKSSAYRVRIPNPMKGGKALRFANREQGAEWLEIRM